MKLSTASRRAVRRSVRRSIGAAWALLAPLALATPVAAHGGVTGPQDVVQDYGVLLFLVAIGVGVLAWVTFSPQADEDDEDESGGEAEAGRGDAAEAPVTPGGSRASR
jgi:hypothetical protein